MVNSIKNHNKGSQSTSVPHKVKNKSNNQRTDDTTYHKS